MSTVPLDPAIVSRIRLLELEARTLVEGLLSGMHRSTQHGFAIEFAQHREYSPGDDIRHLDWKVYARTERFFLKQYEQDTNLTAWLVLDSSESMAYASVSRSKYERAQLLLAALGYLLLSQSDSVGLVSFSDQIQHLVRPSAHPGHLHTLLQVLAESPSGQKTQLGQTLHALAERIPRRGLIFLISDLFDEPDQLREGLEHLRFFGHEVVIWQVLDAAELDFPFDQPTLFRGLEGLPELLTEPRSLRQSYLTELQRFRQQIERICHSLQFDYVLLRSDADLGQTLASYLARRLKRVRV